MSGIALTKLDVLDSFETVKICTGYRLGAEVLDYVPDTATQALVEPVYESWPGWQTDTSGCRAWDELPGAARAGLDPASVRAGVEERFGAHNYHLSGFDSVPVLLAVIERPASTSHRRRR